MRGAAEVYGTVKTHYSGNMFQDKATVKRKTDTFINIIETDKTYKTLANFEEPDFKPTRLESRVTGQSANK